MPKKFKALFHSLLALGNEKELCQIIAMKYGVPEHTVFFWGSIRGQLSFIDLTDEKPLSYSFKGKLVSPHYKLSFKEAFLCIFNSKLLAN